MMSSPLSARLGTFLGALILLALTGGSVALAKEAKMGDRALMRCNALSAVPAREIGLPTSGARVYSATLQVARRPGLAPLEYCKVLAQIAPFDPRSRPITVEHNLPTRWNGKAVQMGGSGVDGQLVTATGPAPGAAGEPPPLAEGFATFGSDGGHQVRNALDTDAQSAAFLDDEVLENFAGAQVKKTRDVAVALIRPYYGSEPRRLYFVGASGGGREALNAVQRWGQDYDGVIAYYPAAGGVPFILALGRDARALSAPGAFPGPAQQALLHRAVLSACDAIDGLTDGIISNPAACSFDVHSLRCPQKAGWRDDCLTEAQISALNLLSADLRLSYPLASGEKGFPGYRLFQGVDPSAHPFGLGAIAPAARPAAGAPIHAALFDIAVRGMITRDLNHDPLTFDPERPGRWQARLSQLSLLLDTSSADLTSFTSHGGKLILVHGTDDPLAPVGWSEAYFRKVQRMMGRAGVDGFMRFYTVPGFGHGSGAFSPNWNSLAALDRWVERGEAPAEPVASDLSPGGKGRSRPLCRYPDWPKYDGHGEVDRASSFTCSKD